MLNHQGIKGIIFGVVSILLFFSTANAALFTASIESLAPEDISGFTVWLDVQDDFSIETGTLANGSATPTSWFADGNLGTIVDEGTTKVAKFGYSDFLGIISGTITPLESGDLFSFEYSGTINDLFLAKFSTLDDPDIFNKSIVLKSFDANGVVFNAVPIPSALLLIGSGLVGLVGFRRKIMS